MRAAWVCVLLCGCITMEDTVRTERGPLLRTFERPLIVEGGVSGRLSVEWPKLSIALEGYDTCRTEKVEEYAEDKIREHRGTGAGASLSAGVAFTVAGGIGLGVSYALSNAPNMERIDTAGNYGPSARVTARGWSIAGLAIGVPALVVGIVQWLRTGEDVETVKVEQVASQRDETCNVRQIDGPIYLRVEDGTAQGPAATKDSVATFEAKQLTADVDSFAFYEREVALDDASRSLLLAFNGCARLEREAVASPEALSTGALLKRLEAARACRQVRGDAVAQEQARLDAELSRRREGGEAGTFLPGAKRLNGFEEAVSAYPPRFTLEDGSADVGRPVEQLTSQSVLLKGRVQAGLSANIGVVSYAQREMFVFLPPDAPWASEDFPLGVKVEVIGIVSGLQTVGELTAPLLRAIWMRKVP
jgi:hypothetical protein